MRTIKFRGRRIDNNEWVYGYYARLSNEFKEWHCIMTEKDASENYIKDCNGYNMLYTPVNHNTVGQFTGLLDKNGEEIYEGDIVEFYHFRTYCINPDCDVHLLGYGIRLIKAVEVVEFKDGIFGVEDDYFGIFSSLDCGLMNDEYFEEEISDPYFDANGYDVENIEALVGLKIIGNKHDNPELLEGGNDESE